MGSPELRVALVVSSESEVQSFPLRLVLIVILLSGCWIRCKTARQIPNQALYHYCSEFLGDQKVLGSKELPQAHGTW